MKFCTTFAVRGVNEDGEEGEYYLRSLGGLDLWYWEPSAYGESFNVIPVDVKKIEPFTALELPRKVVIGSEDIEYIYGGSI